jgi:hypothetical protein
VTIEHLTIIRAPIERCFDLARSVEAHLAGNVHCGETAVATEGVATGLVGLGQRVTWRAKHFGVWHNLTSEITAMDRPAWFQDNMIRGIFLRRYMQVLLRERNAVIKEIAESSEWRRYLP